ncbi:glutamine-hydrolyzing GMP synthase [Candidatus Woesearchaeota archaeon]|nr:glutamine-hydrolyzing GMP synthase [Candidatus Woesearchaeota archaeon]
MAILKPQIYILDFGSQYTHLIARRIRQLNVYSEIKLPTVSLEEIKDAKGIILSGGPASVYDKTAVKYNPEIFKLKIPILGLCYGQQLMAQALGGKVSPGEVKEYGFAELEIEKKKKSRLFAGLKNTEIVWMSHGDYVSKLPKEFEAIGSTKDCKAAAFENKKQKRFGLQFHPEVTHTPNGMKIIGNFVKICKCKKNWTMHNYLKQAISDMREKVGKRNVFMLISGGVDSTVAFALLNKALGSKRVYGLNIDNGFLRLNEAEWIVKKMKSCCYANFHQADASYEFLDAVRKITDPEQKRKVIGKVFIDVQRKVLQSLKLDHDDWLLGQGTIYPDTIETQGTKHADLIKTHHNRVEIIQQMIKKGKIIEPLMHLYKDEVRELGKELRLPADLIWRQPFPGPGLAVRVLCAKKASPIKNVNKINRTLNAIGKFHDVTGFVVPIKSVGVQGDNRTYRHPAVIIGNSSWDTLFKVSGDLTNKVREINRAIFLLYPGKIDPKKLKIKETYLTKQRLDLLRKVTAIVDKAVKQKRVGMRIWQFPVVLAPISLRGGESIILRPVYSKEAMTAEFAKIPWPVVKLIVKKIMKVRGIDAVFYDVTNKPPATIEWE